MPVIVSTHVAVHTLKSEVGSTLGPNKRIKCMKDLKHLHASCAKLFMHFLYF